VSMGARARCVYLECNDVSGQKQQSCRDELLLHPACTDQKCECVSECISMEKTFRVWLNVTDK
jgi:hypothetical protein